MCKNIFFRILRVKAELFEILVFLTIPLFWFFFSSEKNETALNRVELLWYRLSLLIKSQVHLAQRGRENLLQTRFIMAAKDGGTASVLPSCFHFVWNILQRYAGLFKRVWDSISWMGSNIHFIIQNTWPISLSAYDRNIKKMRIWLGQKKNLVQLIIQFYESAGIAFKA